MLPRGFQHGLRPYGSQAGAVVIRLAREPPVQILVEAWCLRYGGEKCSHGESNPLSGGNPVDRPPKSALSISRTPFHASNGVSFSFFLNPTERQLRRLRHQLIAAAARPKLEQIGIDPAWCLAMAGHLTAVLNGWLEP